MKSLLTIAAGRRSKWVVLAIGLVLVGLAASQAGKFEDAQRNEQSSFLPGNSESVAALEQVKRFPSGQLLPAVVVLRRDGGLTAGDRARARALQRDLTARPPERGRPVGPPVISKDGTTALLVVPIAPNDDSDVIIAAVADIRERVASGGGLEAKVTGAAGFAADQFEVFDQIDGTLLLGTALLVLVLLIVIYRSPIFWMLPFLAVLLAEVTSRGLGYGLTELGVTVNGQSASLLVVLVFGAGTDYALLLVARYREELRRHEDRHDAMAVALRRAGPAIIASGLTVIAALLCLLVADLNGTRGLGPISAMGIALAMTTMLTLLPALLLVAGRRAFWPFVPQFGGEAADEVHGLWRRVGDRVAVRPRRVWMGTLAVLALMCGGLVYANTDLTTSNGFRGQPDSVAGQRLVEQAFAAGTNAPLSVIVRDPARLDEVRAALTQAPGVASVGPVERGAPGARFPVTLASDPYSATAFRQVRELRQVADRAGGPATLIGGPTAEEADYRTSARRDNAVIVPIVLVVVFAILALLLRALLVPLVLIGTVIVSYAAGLGVGAFVFEQVFGFAGMDPSLPLFAFIFLVALGVDYNIFLMARVREETLRHGTREGVLRGLAVTGGVITSAGIVLAGTFSILAVLPLVTLTEIGFVIAFGVLLDTFIVRSVLVPALVLDIGDRVWWPSRLGGGRRAESALDWAAEPLELREPAAPRVEQAA